MADLMEQFSQEFGLPVIDGVSADITFAEALVNNRLRTSKIGAYSVN
jgi:allantoin racemase